MMLTNTLAMLGGRARRAAVRLSEGRVSSSRPVVYSSNAYCVRGRQTCRVCFEKTIIILFQHIITTRSSNSRSGLNCNRILVAGPAQSRVCLCVCVSAKLIAVIVFSVSKFNVKCRSGRAPRVATARSRLYVYQYVVQSSIFMNILK